MNEYSNPLRVCIPGQETVSPPAVTSMVRLPQSSTAQRSQFTTEPPARLHFGIQQLNKEKCQSKLVKYDSTSGIAPFMFDPVSQPVAQRHTVGTPPPGTLPSPSRGKSSSPVSSPFQPTGAKSTNFHSVADLIGGSKAHYQENSPGRISPCYSGCVKQQTTPTSSPRLGDQSEEYIDVVHDPLNNSPNSSLSLPDTRTNNDKNKEIKSPERKSKESNATNVDNNRARKGRTIYKAQQVYVLEEIFRRTHYPDPEVIETLSRDLDISENKIKVWFQNKRARWRRRQAETGHPVLPPIPYNHMAPPCSITGWPHSPPGGLHIHTNNPAGTLLVPQPMYPGLQSSPHIPISQPPTSLTMIPPQLQSLYSMDPGLISLKSGLHNFSPLHGINLPMIRMWPESSKLSVNPS